MAKDRDEQEREARLPHVPRPMPRFVRTIPLRLKTVEDLRREMVEQEEEERTLP